MKPEWSDEVLIARLRVLGYTSDLSTTTAEAKEGSADETSADGEDAAEAARFARYRANAPSLLEKLLAAREAEASHAKEAPSRQDLIEDEPPTTNALQSLLDDVDAHPTSLSPSKRPREASRSSASRSESEADSETGPTTPCPAGPSRRRSPRAPRSEPSSPTPAKRTSSSVKLASMATLALLSSHVQAATLSSPFVSAARALDELVTNTDLSNVVQLAQNLQQNRALYDLAQSQASATGRQTGSNLSFLGKHLFAGSPVSPKNPAWAALRLARLLDFDAKSPDGTASPTDASAMPVLTTPRTTCVQCKSALHIREHPTEPVWLVRPAQGAVRCLVAIYICSNRVCRARHAPDHVEIAHQGRTVWLWYNAATVVKIGERAWTTIDGAAHFRHLLLQQAVAPGGIAKLWNRQYAEPDPEDSATSERSDFCDSGDEEDLDEVETPSHSRSAASTSRKGKRARDVAFRLRAAQVWRAIVISSCLLAARTDKYGRFASAVRPSTLDLVDLANACIFDPVLPPHQCSICTRPRQVWIGGPATEAERRAGVLWAGTQTTVGGQALAKDVKLVAGSPVQMAVCDGITIGFFLCAAPGCPNSPEKHRRTARFCDIHYDLHGLCGVVGCGRERSGVQSGGGLSEACDDPAHEERWLKFVRQRDENRDRGWRGRANEPRRRPENSAPASSASLSSDAEDGELSSPDDGDDDDDEVAASRKDRKKGPTHMWALRKSSNLQLLVASCGTPLAWRTFTSGETVREVVNFLSSVHQSYGATENPGGFPAYVAYDRACQVLRHVASTATTSQGGEGGGLPPFLKTSRLVVDGFHRQCHHRDDLLCSTLCDPAPLDGSAPNLVVPLRAVGAPRRSSDTTSTEGKSKHRKEKARTQGRVFQRAFNTSAAEQLNSQLSRFAFVLAGMRAPNFTFLVHALLRYRREELSVA
ncbi:hypothetical protein JCM3774_004356 [Rhodotorula dairenensis]